VRPDSDEGNIEDHSILEQLVEAQKTASAAFYRNVAQAAQRNILLARGQSYLTERAARSMNTLNVDQIMDYPEIEELVGTAAASKRSSEFRRELFSSSSPGLGPASAPGSPGNSMD
jgi:hypothetical protein